MIKKIIQKLKIIFIPNEENNYRPRFLESKVLFYCLILLLLLKLFTIPFFLFFPKNVFFAAIVESALIKLTNQYRQSLALPPLEENPQLKQAALLKAKDILEKEYFSHYSPEGVSPWHWFRIAGYKYKFAGENLAIGFFDSEQVHQAWLASPNHRANLLNPNFQEIGIGVMKGKFQGNEITVVVQLFATPAVSSINEGSPRPVIEVKTKPLAQEVEVEVEKKEKLMIKFLSFFSSDYHSWLQKIIYGLLILIIVSLIINILVRFDIQHPDLIFKTIIFIGLLTLFVLIDKTDMIKLISPDFAIY